MPALSTRRARNLTRANPDESGPSGVSSSAPRSTSPHSELPFERAAALVMGNLRDALSGLLAAIPAPTAKCAEVEEAFGVDPRLAWQVLRIATASNPLAAGTSVPARVSMERLVKAGARRKVPAAVSERVISAFDDFERLVEEHAGDRDRFTSMIASLSREEADELDLKYKKAGFRVASHLWGVELGTQLSCRLLRPSHGFDGMDYLSLCGWFGLHRLRSAAPIRLQLSRVVASRTGGYGGTFTETTMEPLEGAGGNRLLREFCTCAPSDIRVVEPHTADGSRMLDVAGTVGRRSAVSIVTGAVAIECPSPYQNPREPDLTTFSRVRLPTKTLVSDLLVHRDALGVRPPLRTSVFVYGDDRIGAGSDMSDIERAVDLLAVREHCEYLGEGLEVLGTPDVPRYVEMVKSTCRELGWDPSEFQVYRCRVEYPITRSTVRVEFELPPR